ncbi:unnamed protein product [Dicrocoelium dendriticum]|nr:unnamed protein product [Dicrocoelium dendriticum]
MILFFLPLFRVLGMTEFKLGDNVHASFVRDLCSYDFRVQTFVGWPFGGNFKCTAERLAMTGFFHPRDTAQDVAQCFVCFKELEGWEPDDDPAAEHRRHSPECPFLFSKSYEQMSAREGLQMDIIRFANFLHWHNEQIIKSVREKASDKICSIRNQLAECLVKKRGTRRTNRAEQSEAFSEASICSTRSLRSRRQRN